MSKVRMAIAGLTLSAAGAAAIFGFEGFRDKAYLDQVGVPTIGYGTTEGVKIGQRITEPEARARAMKEIGLVYESALKSCVKAPLYQHEYDAYVSLTYNIGGKAFCSSTLVKYVNKQQYVEACTELLKWNKAGGKFNKGLDNRRQVEYRNCLGDPYGVNP